MAHHAMENFHLPQVKMPDFLAQNEVNTDDNSASAGGVGGTEKPVSTGKDEVYPRDCGRDKDTNKGLLCFPDGKLCQDRVNREGNVRFGNHLYWVSWQSNDHRLKTANWDWFNARNYCRKRCMDLVSIETQREYDFIKGLMHPDTKYFWTSGRMCNFEGCDREDFLPKNINGWFWSANQARMNPTNGTRFHDWSQTGGSRPPKPQPDNREKVENPSGDDEACMAVLNNFYGDGVKWHDVACHHEKPIICEDVEGHLNFARQTFPELSIP